MKTDSIWERFLHWTRTVFDGDDTGRPRKPARVDATVRRTRQITGSDCGIAALSMLANVPYAQARQALFTKGERCLGTSHAKMRQALKQFAVPHGRFRKFRSWDEIPSHALVHIRWKELPPAEPGHWVVYQKLKDAFRVLDPASFADTLATTDVTKMIGVEFLPVNLVVRRRATQAGPKSAKRKASLSR